MFASSRRKTRSFPKQSFLSLTMLEARDVPASLVVDPTFNNGTPGWQVTAFNKISDAFTIATAADDITVNAGDYTALDTVTANLTQNIPVNFGVGGDVKMNALAATAGTMTLTSNLTFGDAASTSIAAVFTGASGLVKLGSGTATLTADNSAGFTGTVTVDGGILAVGNIKALGATTAGSGTIVNSGGTLQVATTGTVTAEPITITGDGATAGLGALRNSASATWSGPITIGTGGARINSGASTFIVSAAVGGAGNIEPITFGGSGAMTVSGVINSALAGQVNFDGGNVVTVSGTNGTTLISPILVSNGTEIQIPASTNLGSTAGSGLLTLDNGTITNTTTAGVPTFLNANRTINLAAGGGTLAGSGTAFGIYTGRITGTGNLRLHKPGTATTTILGFTDAGNNTDYVGDTIIQGGTVRLRTNAEVFSPNGVLQINAGGVFDFTVLNAAQTFKGLTGTGTILQSSSTGGNMTILGPSGLTSSFGGTFGAATVKLTLAGLNESTQVITSANTQTGVVTVSGGTLVLANSTGSALGTGTTTVTAPGTNINGGTLATPSTSNNGIMGGALVNNYKLAPGGIGSAGRLTVNNNVTFGAVSEFHVDVRGNTAGFGASGYDQLVTTGTTTITDGAKLLLDFGSFVPTPGDAWTILDNNGANITTKFRDANGALLNEGTEFTVGGALYRITYIGGTGNDVVVTRALPSSTYYVRQDFNASATDLDTVAAGIQVDGDPLNPLEPFATVGVNAFDTIMAAVNKSTVNADKIIVSADPVNSTYAEQVDLGVKEIYMTFQENPITINSIKGTNNKATVTLGTKADLISGILLTMGKDDQSVSLAASIGGVGGIVKVGNGALTLNPVSNSYSGPTSIATVGGGSMVAGSVNAFSALSPFDLSDTARLKLNGFSNTIGNLTGPVGAVVENDNTATAAILTAGSTNIADQSSKDLNFAGALIDGATAGSKSFGFIKVGSGVLTLPAVNSFTGPFGLLGGTYTVDTLPNGGVAGPFGASTNAATNFRLGGGTLVYTGAAVAGFDRNITWNTAGTIQSDSDITFAGVIVGATSTPGGFIKNGTGKFTFTNADAFQAPNSGTAYGLLSTGTITVNAGELVAQNITTRGAIGTRATNVNYLGTRSVVINGTSKVTIKNTLALDPDGSAYVNGVSGTGTLVIDTANASKTNPSIAFDTGPKVSNVGGGDARPFGVAITAPVELVGGNTVFIVGKADRNDLARHSGDLRFNGKITGAAPIQFIGLTSTDSTFNNDADASNMHFVINNDNSTTYTGAVSIANADLALTNANALTAANSLTFNSVIDANTQNRASLFLFGRSVTIGSLNDTSAVGTTSFIRNGAQDTATGGTGTSSGNALGVNADSVLTVMQTADGTFQGAIQNGPYDNEQLAAASTYKALSLVKDGTGKLTLTGTSPTATPILATPIAANITVNAGTLVHNGTINTAAQTITVNTGASFGGSGSVKAVTISGRLSAGTVGTPGTLKTGNISFPAAAEVVADLAGLTAGTQYDQIVVTGTVDLTNAKLTVNETIVAPVPSGTKFVLIDNDGTDPIIGNFDGLLEGDFLTAGGTKFQITYMDGGNDCAMIAVPGFTPPSVMGFTINNAATQRSRVTSVKVTFASDVSPASFANAGDITLTRYASTPTGINGTIVQTGAVGANGLINVTQPGPLTELVLTFSNADASDVTSGVEYLSLADGRWELAIPSASYFSGQPTTPNPPALHRLFGDVDGNATVDAVDFSFFPAFGALAGSPFDYNNNSDIDSGTDFSQFGNRVGLSL